MSNASFIKEIASCVQELAPKYGISVCSPIIAQACLESAYGTSNKAKHHNYFGLKYRDGRVAVADGYFSDTSKEQKSDGTYTNITTKWFKFSNMRDGVEGYFQFINISNYKNLKGVTNPQTYLENIKADGYATSINYVSNLMSVIKANNLTQYDKEQKMRITVHAGHNPDGKTACGAVGLIKESTEARAVTEKVISLLQADGHTVYDCTCNNGTSQSDVLQKIVNKCNANDVDLNVSIHFNSGAKDTKGNNSTTGTEVWLYSTNSKAQTYAENVCKCISSLGYKNRGVKYSKDLYFLGHTYAPAMLIECCFVDDKDDTKLYNAESMAQAIVKGILGKVPCSDTSTTKSTSTTSTTVTYYKRCDKSYSSIVDAMKSIGIANPTLAFRKKVAKKNGIATSDSVYMNTKLLQKLKNGKLIKA